MVGPLNGLCLRNLVWHGYVGEVEGAPWASLLWIVVAFGLAPRCAISNSPSPTATSPLPMLLVPSEDAIEDLLACSAVFVPPYLQLAFREAMQLCREPMKPEQQWRCLTLLFVVLERGLRALYAQENHFPDNALLARTDTLATMLRSTVGDEDENNNSTPHSRNKMLDYLSRGAVAALYDEFVWIGLHDASGAQGSLLTTDALPCRNKLVHRSLEFENISLIVVERVVKLTLGLAAFSATKPPVDSIVRDCLDCVSQYQSKRHPVCHRWHQLRTLCHGNFKYEVLDELLPPQSNAFTYESRPIA